MALEVVATKNGPYLLTGDLTQLDLRDGDGNLHDLAGRSRRPLQRRVIARPTAFIGRDWPIFLDASVGKSLGNRDGHVMWSISPDVSLVDGFPEAR